MKANITRLEAHIYIYIYIYVCVCEREREREILLIYKLLVFPFMFGVLVTASCN